MLGSLRDESKKTQFDRHMPRSKSGKMPSPTELHVLWVDDSVAITHEFPEPGYFLPVKVSISSSHSCWDIWVACTWSRSFVWRMPVRPSYNFKCCVAQETEKVSFCGNREDFPHLQEETPTSTKKKIQGEQR